MTTLQLNNEKTSIERFVAAATEVAREHGTDASTTCVIRAAARAAADMAPRLEDGTIDAEIARVMVRRAARGLTRIR